MLLILFAITTGDIQLTGTPAIKTTPDEVISFRLLDADGVEVELASGDAVELSLLPAGLSDTDPLTVNGTPTRNDADDAYTLALDAFTDAACALLGINDGSTTADKPFAPCDCALRYTPSGGTPVESDTFTLDLRATRFLPGAGTPVGVPAPAASWLPRVPFDALTGGSATALDGMVTLATVTTGALAFTYVSSKLRAWLLLAGTTAEDAAAGIVRPDDYHVTSNPRVWTEVAWG